jgi:hypothetical protein
VVISTEMGTLNFVPIIQTKIISKSDQGVDGRVVLQFHMQPQLKAVIHKHCCARLDALEVVPTFIVSKVDEKVLLKVTFPYHPFYPVLFIFLNQDLNLQLLFNKQKEPTDFSKRLTFVVVESEQLKLCVPLSSIAYILYSLQCYYHHNRYHDYMTTNKIANIILLTVGLNFNSSSDAVLEIIKQFAMHFKCSHIWLADHCLADLRGKFFYYS